MGASSRICAMKASRRLLIRFPSARIAFQTNPGLVGQSVIQLPLRYRQSSCAGLALALRSSCFAEGALPSVSILPLCCFHQLDDNFVVVADVAVCVRHRQLYCPPGPIPTEFISG